MSQSTKKFSGDLIFGKVGAKENKVRKPETTKPSI